MSIVFPPSFATRPSLNDASKLVLVAFARKKIAKKVHNGFLLQILKFARVKKLAVADGTAFIPNMMLFQINHADHQAMTAGTLDLALFILLGAHLGIARVESF